MELHELKANIRTTTGKGPAHGLRAKGDIPAVLYGPKTEPVLVSVNARELERLLKNIKVGQSLLNLLIQNGQTTSRTVMIKELQVHPLSRKFLHADFYEVDMEQKLRVSIPVRVTGKCQGVEMGGFLQIIRRELEILCYPNQIPDSIEIDVTDLNIGDAVHVKDIDAGEGTEIPAEVNFTVITVLGAKGKDEEEEGEGEEGEETAEEGADAETTKE